MKILKTIIVAILFALVFNTTSFSSHSITNDYENKSIFDLIK